MPLSDAKIRILKATDKPYKVADFDGLYLLVKVSGSKSWRFKYRLSGKEKLLVIGDYPSISLAQARLSRDAARTLVANETDPSEAKQERARIDGEAKAQTFAKLAAAFVDKITKEGRAPSTLVKYEWLLGMLNADIGKRPITEVTAPHLLRALRKLEAKGHYETARKMKTAAGSVFRFAIANGIAENDPTFALRGALIRPKTTPRAAITDPKQLGGLLRAIGDFQGQTATRIALELQALLAQRPGELRLAVWDEFDLKAAIWSIPAERMKMRVAHRVPLPTNAVNLLRKLQELTGFGKFLFPSLRTTLRPMSEGTLIAALRRMGYGKEEMTPHGFRATFSTLANESGKWNPDAIERSLAHVDGNEVRRAYARGEHWEERLRLAEWWAGFLDACRCDNVLTGEDELIES